MKPLLLALPLVILCACGEKDDTAPPEGDTDADSDTDSDTDADSDADTDVLAVQGTVVRTMDPSQGGTDGILCLAVVSECPSIQNMGDVEGYDGHAIPGFSIPDLDTPVPFGAEFDPTLLVAGTVYAINGYLETDAGECDEEGPSLGELVTFNEGNCPVFTWKPGVALEDVVVTLNLSTPF